MRYTASCLRFQPVQLGIKALYQSLTTLRDESCHRSDIEPGQPELICFHAILYMHSHSCQISLEAAAPACPVTQHSSPASSNSLYLQQYQHLSLQTVVTNLCTPSSCASLNTVTCQNSAYHSHHTHAFHPNTPHKSQQHRWPRSNRFLGSHLQEAPVLPCLQTPIVHLLLHSTSITPELKGFTA
jgi:hypothetical protein